MVKSKKSLMGADFLEWGIWKRPPVSDRGPGAVSIVPKGHHNRRFCGDITQPAAVYHMAAAIYHTPSGVYYFDSSASFAAARVMPMVMKKANMTLG